MATIRERAKARGVRVFHAQVRQTGFPARTASFPTQRQAERWAKTIEADMIEGRHFRSAEARRRKIGEAIERYCLEMLPGKKDAGKNEARLNGWKAAIGELRIADLTPAVLAEQRGKLITEKYTRSKPGARYSCVEAANQQKFSRSRSTVNRYMAALSHVCTVARKEWHGMSHNPFDGIAQFKEGRGSIRYLRADERKRLLAETVKDADLHAFTIIALSTACRAGELLKLTWRDVDLDEKQLLFRDPKNRQTRVAWIHGDALTLLRKRADAEHEESGRVLTNAAGGAFGYEHRFKAACIAAKVSEFRFHDLRHSAATYLARDWRVEIFDRQPVCTYCCGGFPEYRQAHEPEDSGRAGESGVTRRVSGW